MSTRIATGNFHSEVLLPLYSACGKWQGIELSQHFEWQTDYFVGKNVTGTMMTTVY